MVGEEKVARLLQGLYPEYYKVFHDLYLPRPDGKGTTQVDHVVVSRFGIFVIETKYLGGWIFGDANRKMWTHSLYGHSTQFQNPLHQNRTHIGALERFLGLAESQFHSLVIFLEGEFKTEMPVNVITADLCGWIKGRFSLLLDEKEFLSAVGKLEALNRETNREAARLEHSRTLQQLRTQSVLTSRNVRVLSNSQSRSATPRVSPWQAGPQERRDVTISLEIAAPAKVEEKDHSEPRMRIIDTGCPKSLPPHHWQPVIS